MYAVQLTAAAERDLLRLTDFLAELDEHAAWRARDAIREGLLSLEQMPSRSLTVGPGRRELYIRFGDSGYVV